MKKLILLLTILTSQAFALGINCQIKLKIDLLKRSFLSKKEKILETKFINACKDGETNFDISDDGTVINNSCSNFLDEVGYRIDNKVKPVTGEMAELEMYVSVLNDTPVEKLVDRFTFNFYAPIDRQIETSIPFKQVSKFKRKVISGITFSCN